MHMRDDVILSVWSGERIRKSQQTLTYARFEVSQRKVTRSRVLLGYDAV